MDPTQVDANHLEPVQIKAVMLDMARVTEQHGYYQALPERLARWGYNALFLHFNDDQGCAMQFQTHSELASPHAFTQQQMRDYIALAREHGIMVVPELESFGHTTYIHGRERYKHLREPTRGHFNALNPLHPDTQKILDDLVEETAQVFDAPFIHAGLDEVNFGGSTEVQAALKTQEKYEIFADQINRMHERIHRRGRRMMMWADHLCRSPRAELRIADLIPKDIIMCHWLYWRDLPAEHLQVLIDKGFDVIGAPAAVRGRDLVMPGPTAQVNMQRFAQMAHAGGPRVVGLLNTVWESGRVLWGMEQFALALGGGWFNDPQADPRDVMRRFVETQFNIHDAADPIAAAILRLSANAPLRQDTHRLLNVGVAQLPMGPLTAHEVVETREMLENLTEAREALLNHRDQVRENEHDYDNFILAADVLKWACEVALERTAGFPGNSREEMRERGEALLERCRTDWDHGRYADDPKKEQGCREPLADVIETVSAAVEVLRRGGTHPRLASA